MEFDENGWAVGAVEALGVDEAWSLLSPEPAARVDAERWAGVAQAFFRARIALATPKRYPSGALPRADCAFVDVTGPLGGDGGERARVLVVTVPIDRASNVRAAALAGAAAIGGAGFDALVARARRVWQVRREPEEGFDARAPLLLSAVLASVFLGPIVPPGGGTIFGVKGARERLAKEGFRV